VIENDRTITLLQRKRSAVKVNKQRVRLDTDLQPDLRNKKMIRKAFMMSLNPGSEEEYQRRHSPIWPELEQTLKAHGVHNYSIFLLAETQELFAYVEIESETQWAAIATTPTCQGWWRHMSDCMRTQPDLSPVSQNLREVFHMD
jgi:L-rhamnose mutarotase